LKAKSLSGITKYCYPLPALIIVLIFLISPVIFVIYTSLMDWDLIRPMKFVGFANYLNLFKDPVLLTSLGNTLIWVVLILSVPMILGLLLAVFIRNIWLANKIKTIFYIPLAISGTAIGVIWKWIFSRIGLLNDFLIAIGIIKEPINWLLEIPGNTFAMIAASTWQITGINMILFLIGLQNIPSEVLEAAKIDGANDWKTFIHVILPLLKQITTVVVVLNIIGSFKVFEIIWVITSGGPGRGSETLALSMYVQSFGLFQMGYGAAIAVVLSLIIFAIGIFYLRIVGKENN